MNEWLILTATLPTAPSALRVRVWRALKATGCGTLRDGVYILPAAAATAPALRALEGSIQAAGATAHLLVVQARDAAQEQAFRDLFDRAGLYAEWLQSLKEAQRDVAGSAEAPLRKRLRTLEQQLLAIQASDFFPGEDHERSTAALAAYRREVDLYLSPGEPSPRQAAIPPLKIEDFQGRIWATRKRPWVDRLATAWLVQRFVDRAPTFLWLDDPVRCPASALGYDFDGARFSHVEDKVSFEVVARSFGLDADPALRRLGALVHGIDIGGIPADEAPGIEMLVRGLQARHPRDDDLLAAAVGLFDALFAALETTP